MAQSIRFRLNGRPVALATDFNPGTSPTPSMPFVMTVACLELKLTPSEALAAAIRRGLDDEQLRAKVGAAGRQRVVERWSWRYCASLTVDQYREVLAMPHNVEKLRRRIAKGNA